jgi:HPt (histidine-containing phosphotransfer) domain-containing protein
MVDASARDALDAERFAALRRGLVSPEALPRLVGIFEDASLDILDELRTAIEAGDSASVRELAHKLRGGCVSLAAVHMGELCRELEERAADGVLDGAGERFAGIDSAFADAVAALRAQAAVGC